MNMSLDQLSRQPSQSPVWIAVADATCSPMRPKTGYGLPVTWLPTAVQIAWIDGISCLCHLANSKKIYLRDIS